MTRHDDTRRRFFGRALAAGSGLLLTGCDQLSQNAWFTRVLGSAEKLTQGTQRLLLSRKSMAQEFSEADISPQFRSNGTSNPNNPLYQTWVASGFADYRLQVDGLVARPRAYTLDELKALPSRTQITRHDCVEGWSAIGKWKGVSLSHLLAQVEPHPQANYVVFHCADPMNGQGSHYYESIDMDDAWHVQTVLAYDLNDAPLPVKNGAPIRVRVERQLGYKSAKYLTRIELVERFDHIGKGRGGYWEDRGYEWYAGI
ncbi:MAG: molybdopterin-binding protein [Hydrogenophilales bacterium 16-64-46]|nr:MAG: molybdopterin-binding protein [Hydrogenophilales bacterium 12-64-13]OYZ07122.1 MAG: molybdopterin-binding protein [Hydrogenophilales bacterium 16-64-46]OZA37830.1 MAG: molybdopterin-binding protein [Hydrogenophilales bacterium 17-64-34]HQS99208.1 molybdopterin-binding protein [Thiobacillus sp.]